MNYLRLFNVMSLAFAGGLWAASAIHEHSFRKLRRRCWINAVLNVLGSAALGWLLLNQ